MFAGRQLERLRIGLEGVVLGTLGVLLVTGLSIGPLANESGGTLSDCVHVVVGLTSALAFGPYLIAHLRAVGGRDLTSSDGFSRLTGMGVLISFVVAAASGLDLGLGGPVPTRMFANDVHRLASWSTYLLLFVHLVRLAIASGVSAAGVRRSRDAVVLGGLAAACATVPFLLGEPAPPVRPVPGGYTFAKGAPGKPFAPGRARVAGGGLIAIENLSGSARCAVCHQDIYRQWQASSHRHAASNDHYSAQVRLRISDVPVKPWMGARFCAGCHEPVALLAGEVDPKGRGIEFARNQEEGIACLVCHRIQALDRGQHGNANYVIAPHIPSPLQDADTAVLSFLGQMVLRGRPQAHREEMMRPLLTDSIFCSACHEFSVGPGINPNGRFQLQSTFGEWAASSFNDPSHPSRHRRCQDCHMPLEEATRDAAAKPTPGNPRRLVVRSHRFLGSNTMRPFLDGDTEQLQRTRTFLENSGVALSIRLHEAPVAGQNLDVEVSISNSGVGHRFPTGTTDMHDCWLELSVRDENQRVIHASGQLSPLTGEVDAQAFQLVSRAIDPAGNWLYRRDMWNLAAFSPSVTVRPGGEVLAGYRFLVPEKLAGPLEITAFLRFRKSNPRFTRFVLGRGNLRDQSGYRGPHPPYVDLPIVTVARAERKALVRSAEASRKP